jgi:hypothetical protein
MRHAARGVRSQRLRCRERLDTRCDRPVNREDLQPWSCLPSTSEAAIASPLA